MHGEISAVLWRFRNALHGRSVSGAFGRGNGIYSTNGDETVCEQLIRAALKRTINSRIT